MNKKIFKSDIKKYRGILNGGGLTEPPVKGGKWGKPQGTRKYQLRENGRPHPKVVSQYSKIINILSFNRGVVLDFGCSMAHASFIFKERAPRSTYVGADLDFNALLAAKEVYNPKFLYKVKYGEPCLSYIKNNSIDLLIVSRLTNWSGVDNFFPEFNRVLKEGGHLFVWSNAGGCHSSLGHEVTKLKVYKYLKDNYKSYKMPGKDLESFSKALWGDPNRHKRLSEEFTKEERKKTFNGIFIKK